MYNQNIVKKTTFQKIILTGSLVKTTEIDLQSFNMRKFSEDYTFYWRILKSSNELEGVIVANATSWVGVGWRPSSLTSACKALPEISDRFKKDSGSDKYVSKAEPESEPKSKPEPTSEPEPPAEPHPESEPKSEPEPKSESKFSLFRPGGAKRRSAKVDTTVTPRPEADVTVQTRSSVTYRVSTKQGKTGRCMILLIETFTCHCH